MAHTPGPWSIFIAQIPEYQAVVTAKDASLVASVRHGKGIDEVANACLIAAAPELLEVAEWAYQHSKLSWIEKVIAKAKEGKS